MACTKHYFAFITIKGHWGCTPDPLLKASVDQLIVYVITGEKDRQDDQGNARHWLMDEPQAHPLQAQYLHSTQNVDPRAYSTSFLLSLQHKSPMRNMKANLASSSVKENWAAFTRTEKFKLHQRKTSSSLSSPDWQQHISIKEICHKLSYSRRLMKSCLCCSLLMTVCSTLALDFSYMQTH